jgi:hypothetical protein
VADYDKTKIAIEYFERDQDAAAVAQEAAAAAKRHTWWRGKADDVRAYLLGKPTTYTCEIADTSPAQMVETWNGKIDDEGDRGVVVTFDKTSLPQALTNPIDPDLAAMLSKGVTFFRTEAACKAAAAPENAAAAAAAAALDPYR